MIWWRSFFLGVACGVAILIVLAIVAAVLDRGEWQ